MVTFGDRSRSSYRGGRLPAAVLVLVCLVTVFFQPASASAHRNRNAARTESTSSKRMWCEAKANAAWRGILNRSGHVVALSRRVSLVPMALAGDGRSFFTEIYSKAYSGVISIDALSGRYTKVKRFPDPVNDQARGDFDGRWLVWAEYHSLYDTSDFTVWSWDSRTYRVREIGAATRSPSGDFWPSALQAPVAHDGYATWEQGSGVNNLGDIHVVNLKAGRDRIVRHGHAGGSLLVRSPTGSIVVWPESMKPNALTVMRAANARTGQYVATPPALRKVRGGLVPVTDGGGIAYITNQWRTLWWSPSLNTEARPVVTVRAGYAIDNSVQIGGRYVFFGIQPRSFIADAKSGRYIKINQGGWARLDKKALVFLKPSREKANHALSDVIFLPLRSLPPIPPCK